VEELRKSVPELASVLRQEPATLNPITKPNNSNGK
jgi:hypothetical protein